MRTMGERTQVEVQHRRWQSLEEEKETKGVAIETGCNGGRMRNGIAVEVGKTKKVVSRNNELKKRKKRNKHDEEGEKVSYSISTTPSSSRHQPCKRDRRISTQTRT